MTLRVFSTEEKPITKPFLTFSTKFSTENEEKVLKKGMFSTLSTEKHVENSVLQFVISIFC